MSFSFQIKMFQIIIFFMFLLVQVSCSFFQDENLKLRVRKVLEEHDKTIPNELANKPKLSKNEEVLAKQHFEDAKDYETSGGKYEVDNKKAFELYTKSAEMSYILAQYELAKIYTQGKLVERDLNNVLYWYRYAAEQGHVVSQFMMVDINEENGRPIEALKWRKITAINGVAQSQNDLGVLYQYGGIEKQDYVESIKWYQKAIDQGYDESMNNLAWMITTSKDLPSNLRDDKKALMLAKKSCELTEFKNHRFLDTLAAVYANLEQWDDALKYQTEAVKLVDDQKRKDFENQLKLYKNKQKYRE